MKLSMPYIKSSMPYMKSSRSRSSSYSLEEEGTGDPLASKPSNTSCSKKSHLYRKKPPMPPNPLQNCDPSCDLFETISSLHPYCV